MVKAFMWPRALCMLGDAAEVQSFLLQSVPGAFVLY